jgi:hypothetical protein
MTTTVKRKIGGTGRAAVPTPDAWRVQLGLGRFVLCALCAVACEGGVSGRGTDSTNASAAVAGLEQLDGAATLLVRIGSEAPAFAEFGRIRDLAVDSQGTAYVLDGHSRRIHVYDSAGAAVTSFAGQGSGPGELESPRGLAWGPGDNLWVMDYRHNRYTEFSPAGEVLRTFQRQIPAQGTDWQGVFDRDGRLYDVAVARERPEPQVTRELLVRYDISGDALLPNDTFFLPERVARTFTVDFPGGMLSLPVPFAPVSSWAFDGEGAIWYGNGEDPAIIKTSLRGDTLLIIQRDDVRVRVPTQARTSAMAELDSILNAVGGNQAQLDVSSIPTLFPRYGRLLVDKQSRLWVAHYAANVEPTSTFDVYDSSGKPIGSVRLGFSSRLPIAFGSSVIAGVARDDFGVDHVVIYRVNF